MHGGDRRQDDDNQRVRGAHDESFTVHPRRMARHCARSVPQSSDQTRFRTRFSTRVGKIAIRLLRVKEETGAARLAENPLSEQFERELRPVPELVGLPRTVLPAAIEKQGARTPNVQ